VGGKHPHHCAIPAPQISDKEESKLLQTEVFPIITTIILNRFSIQGTVFEHAKKYHPYYITNTKLATGTGTSAVA